MKMKRATIYLALIKASQVLSLRQPIEYLKALAEFQEGFIDSGPIVAMGRSPLFADDIVGRVDVTTNFVGNELNTEYIYGLWHEIAQDNSTTTILGSPVSSTTQSLLVQPPMVFASTILQLYYATINYTLPVQVDMIAEFNDNLKLTSYDISFRRWPEAYKYLRPMLAPQIAKEFGLPYNSLSNDSQLVTLRAATDVCKVAQEHCVGENVQYSSMADCMLFLTETTPFGDIWEGGLNTGWCRYIHKNMVKYRPEVHCPHIGKTGGDMCIDRTYLEVVNGYPYKETLIASYASIDPADVKRLSASAQEGVASSFLTITYPGTIAFYPVPVMILFVVLYLAALASTAILGRKSKSFEKLGVQEQRSTVMHLISAVVTTIALGAQLWASPLLAENYSVTRYRALTFTAVLVSALYIFEIVYRISMRMTLVAHHFCTLFAIISIFITLADTHHPRAMGLGLIFLFQTTVEQGIHIGFFMKRLNYNKLLVKRVLRVAIIQTIACKFAAAVALLAYWGLFLAKYKKYSMDIYLSVVVVVVGVALFIAQQYQSVVVSKIASSISVKRTTARSGEAGVPASRPESGSTVGTTPPQTLSYDMTQVASSSDAHSIKSIKP